MKGKITIIGAGNMGQAIGRGLLRRKIITKNQLFLTNSQTKNNKKAAEKADIVIFAVKPQKIKEVLLEMENLCTGKLIISVVAGVKMRSIAEKFGRQEQKIVRVMPNLGARVGESMSVWVANEFVTEADKVQVRQILGAIGKEIEIDNEDMIDAVTAISGSGPAYFFYFVEQLTFMGQQFGFSEEVSRTLAEQTFIGAAAVLTNSTEEVETLRRAVTSKGGTTETAIKVFEKRDLQGTIRDGVLAAFEKARELGGGNK